VKRICHIQLTPEQATLERCLRVPPHVLIFCSQALLTQNNDLLRRLCPRTSCCVVVNSVDTDRLCPGPPPGELVEELRLTPGQPVVSLIGQVCERKGHPHFLEMAGKLRAEFPQARFLVVGSDLQTGGAYQRQMEQYAQRLGVADVVSFLGFRTDVGDLIRASDVIVLPSRDEGLPLSLLEAAACAKPIVAYQTPGVDEVVLDGRNGFLTPHNAAALASAVGQLLHEPHTREQMGQAGREHMEKKFSLKAQVEAIQSIYDRLLGGN
jgi:glycosyltransferase involved in cell wall biosynthesis